MFDTLFHYPRVLARHCESPAAKERALYLASCASGGAAHSTLPGLAPELLVIARRLDLDGERSIPFSEIEVAADRWVDCQRRHNRVRFANFSKVRLIRTAAAWLRFLGQLVETEEKPAEFVGLHPASQRRSYLQLRDHGLPRHGLPPCCLRAFTGARSRLSPE